MSLPNPFLACWAPAMVVLLSAPPDARALAGSGSPTRQRAATAAPAEGAAAPWSFLGLGERRVTELRLHEDFLYACTDDGVYRKALSSADTLWTGLGPAGRRVLSLWVGSPDTLLASVALLGADSVSLRRSTDGGASWHPYQNGFGADRYPEVRDLEGLGKPGGLLGVAASIEMSTDAGATWRRKAEGCVFNFVRRNPAADGEFWAGGETCIFSPVILRSVDGGESWRLMVPEAGGDNACDAVAFHPTDPQVVYTGMEGQIQRTLDGGDHWQEVTSPSSHLYFFGIAIRPRLPLRLYAAGAQASPLPGVVLYTSDDEGLSWTEHAEPAPLRFGVFDLQCIERQGEVWLLLATDRGVYRWVDDTTALQPSSWSTSKSLYRPAAPPPSR